VLSSSLSGAQSEERELVLEAGSRLQPNQMSLIRCTAASLLSFGWTCDQAWVKTLLGSIRRYTIACTGLSV
jgi:hypothetical protein